MHGASSCSFHYSSAGSVLSLLKLADQFDIKMVADECERFLVDSSAISYEDKIVLADQYSLPDLLVCLSFLRNSFLVGHA